MCLCNVKKSSFRPKPRKLPACMKKGESTLFLSTTPLLPKKKRGKQGEKEVKEIRETMLPAVIKSLLSRISAFRCVQGTDPSKKDTNETKMSV